MQESFLFKEKGASYLLSTIVKNVQIGIREYRSIFQLSVNEIVLSTCRHILRASHLKNAMLSKAHHIHHSQMLN